MVSWVPPHELATKMSIWNTSHSIGAFVAAVICGYLTSWQLCFWVPATLAVWLGTVAIFLLAAILFAFAGGVAPLHDHFQSDTIHSPRRWWGLWPFRLMLKGLAALPHMLWQVIRHQLGALIVVTLVTTLVVFVASSILQLPAFILSTANVQAQVGLAAGDAVDLPENFAWINFATFSFCGLLQAYIHLSTLFPLYYVWGNTKKR